MTVPINFHGVLLDDFLLDEFYQRLYAVRRCVPDGICETDSPCPGLDRRTIEGLDRLRPGPRRVLRDVHDRQAVLHRVGDRLFGRRDDAVHRPILCILPDWGGADERRGFDLDPHLIGDADDRLDIGDDGPRRTIRGDRELMIADLHCERPYLVDDARTGARQADVGGHDAQVGHQVQQPLFYLQRRIGHGRRLQPVAECLVVEINPGTAPIERTVWSARAVPVVDELPFLHARSVASPLSEVKDTHSAPLQNPRQTSYFAIVIDAVLQNERVRAAGAFIERSDEATLGRQAALSAIPAPTGAEGARGARVADMLGGIGLQDVHVDDVGNVRGWYNNGGSGACVILSAHLDTVFGPELDVSVARRGARLEGPGIADNARGLAALVTIGEALVRARVDTRRPVLLAATVGEEGSGDLRGVRHLFGPSAHPPIHPSAFIALDGAGIRGPRSVSPTPRTPSAERSTA